MRKSDVLVLISAVFGTSVIGAGMSIYIDIINDLGNGPKDVAYRSLLRLGDTLTPSKVTPQNIDITALPERLNNTIDHADMVMKKVTEIGATAHVMLGNIADMTRNINLDDPQIYLVAGMLIAAVAMASLFVKDTRER